LISSYDCSNPGNVLSLVRTHIHDANDTLDDPSFWRAFAQLAPHFEVADIRDAIAAEDVHSGTLDDVQHVHAHNGLDKSPDGAKCAHGHTVRVQLGQTREMHLQTYHHLFLRAYISY
jgi:hypothetical protein